MSYIAETFGVDFLERLKLVFNRPVEIHFKNPQSNLESDSYKVLWLFSEPSGYCLSAALLEKIHSKFDLILTHNPFHSRYVNAVVVPWVDISTGISLFNSTTSKQFMVSGLLSGRISGPPGHALRYKLFEKLDPTDASVQFFISKHSVENMFIQKNPIWKSYVYPADDRTLLLNSRFNIAIENYIEPYYHSEKLFDMIVGETVPIYYGCQEISWLDERGLIRANGICDYLSILSDISPSLYDKLKPYLIENRKAVLNSLSTTMFGFKIIEKYLDNNQINFP